MNWWDPLVGYLLLYGSCWIHELGHYITATLLIGRPVAMWVDWRLFGQTLVAVAPGEWTGWRAIVILLTGPLAGIISVLAVAIYIGMSDPFQSVIVLSGVSLHLDQLMPYDKSDGQQILNILGITVPSLLLRWMTPIRFFLAFLLALLAMPVLLSRLERRAPKID